MLSTADANSHIVFRTYIATRQFNHIAYRVLYGVRLHLPEGIMEGIGWIYGTQPVVAQKYALATVLDASAISERSLKTEIILRTEYLRQSLDAGRSRKTKMQHGMRVDPLRTDEELYERTPTLYDMYGTGMRMADPNNPREGDELSTIERTLKRHAWRDPELFRSAKQSHPVFSL